jgi:hypothetical protein
VLRAIMGRVLVWSWQKCSVRSSVPFALNLRYKVYIVEKILEVNFFIRI